VAVDVSSSSTTATNCITATSEDVPNLPVTGSKAQISGTLLWPIAAHATMQPMSQKALVQTIGLETSQLESPAEELTTPTVTKTVATQQVTTTAQLPAFALGAYAGLARGRFIAVNKTPSISLVGPSNAPLRRVFTQAAGKPVSMPRCFILRPVCTSAMTTNNPRNSSTTACRPITQTVPGISKSTVENKQHVVIPAVHTTIRHILMQPRAIPQSTFSVSASTMGCRVVQAKTMAVPRLQHPLAAGCNSLQGLEVITSAAHSEPAAADETRKDSPLSCIHTLVANTETATQWIAINDKITNFNSGVVSQSDSDDSNMVIQLTVSADNNSGLASTATDKQASCFIRKRLSATDDPQSKIAKQS